MPFTTVNLSVLNPIFDKCVADAAAAMKQVSGSREAARLKTVCAAAAKAEINRQGTIYVNEETAYINKIKTNHQNAKPIAAGVIDAAKRLDGAWDDTLFSSLGPKVRTLETLKDEAHAELAGAVAHQAFRSNQPWDFAKSVAAIGQQEQDQLFALFKTHRDPMIAATADLKTFVIKLDEFYDRGVDSLKAAAACKARTGVNGTQLLTEVKTLVKNAIENKAAIASQGKDTIDVLQKFVILCNTQKTKLDPLKVKAAEQAQTGKGIWLKNNKTTTKTMEVALENLRIRASKGALPPQMVSQVTGALGQTGDALSAARKDLDAVTKQLDTHSKKIAEAKSR